MAVSKTVTLNGGVGTFDGSKILTVAKNYSGAVSAGALEGASLDGSKNATAGATVEAVVPDGKVTMVDASAAGKVTVTGSSSKATSISLGGGGGVAIANNKGADKLYGGSGADTFVLTGTKDGGSDIIGDTKNQGYGKGDVISLTGAKTSDLSFTDNITKNTVVITNTDKGKITVTKTGKDIPLTIKGSDGGTLVYGVDGKITTNDGKTLKITNQATANGTYNASTLAAGVKIIDATGVGAKAVNIVGNGQNDAISLGSGGGTVYGGYDSVKNKPTTDNLFASKTRTNNAAVTFLIDENSGSDNIYNYNANDTIVIDTGDSKELDFSSASVLKDGGAGKDVAITYKDKYKVTIKQNTANKITFKINGTTQYYGVDLPTGVSLDSKRAAISVGADAAAQTLGIEGWSHSGYSNGTSEDNALKQMAPKLNTIDANLATKDMVLKGQATVASVLKGGKAHTTMIGGTAADQFYGGTGSDVFVVDISSATGKDVLNSVGAGDVIMVKGYNANDTAQAVSISTKGVLTYYSDTKSTAYKQNSLTVKTIKQNTTTPVVVVDEKGKILAVTTNSSVPGPTGLDSGSRGISTNKEYNGKYSKTDYVKGGTVDLSNGKIQSGDINTDLGLDGTKATINANDYGGTAKQINATAVGAGLESLYIKGNETTKNTIYAPTNRTGNKPLAVTLEGGTAADTFYGNTTSTVTSVFYNIEAGGKDVINAYNEGDTIRLNGVTVTGSEISEKGTDVTFTFNNKDNLTIKNGATKAITFVDDFGKPITYGHTLPVGLEYDAKHTAINATDAINTEDSPFVDVFNKNTQKITELGESPIKIDLSKVTSDTSYYYTTIKTVSLSGAKDPLVAKVSGNSLANEIYAPQGGGTLYGGAGSLGSKPSADKLYGNVGSDTFVYVQGDGADVIGAKNKANSTLEAKDQIILGGKDTVLTRDDITFTDKKEVLTIQFNDDKTSKLTINKADAATPVKIYFTASDTKIINSDTYLVYGIDSRYFQSKTSASDFGSGKLDISDVGTNENATVKTSFDDGSSETTRLAIVDVKNVSSALKQISVSNSSTTVSLLGGVSALNVSLNAGGGTVQGGANGTKALADKFYASANANARGTTFVLNSSTGGKDQIYNYDAARGDVLYFEDGAPTSVSFSTKSITFSYSDSKHAFTIYPRSGQFSASSNVAIAYPDENGNIISKTYYGWDAKQKSFSAYSENVRDDMWNKPNPSGDTYIFTGKTKNRDTLAGAAYTLQGAHIIDEDENYVPDGVVITSKASGTEPNVTPAGAISFADTVYVDPDIAQFKIKGNAVPSILSGESEVTEFKLEAGDTLKANGLSYRLANVDNNTIGFLELSYNGFVKTGTDQVVYYGENTGADGTFLDNSAKFTLTGAASDPGTTSAARKEAEENSVIKGFLDGFSESDTKNDDTVIEYGVSVFGSSETDLTGAHLKLADTSEYAKYALRIGAKATTKNYAVYKLYDKDGDTLNGYELLRTDISSTNGWTLATGEENEDPARLQSKNTGYWDFSSNTTKFAFTITSEAGITAADDGMPNGVSVVSDKTSGTTLVFNAELGEKISKNPGYLQLDSDPSIFGSNTKTVLHISGVEVGTAFTVKSGTDGPSTVYTAAELDGNEENGLELLKENATGWLYSAGAWTYDNRRTEAWKQYSDTSVESNLTKVAPVVNFTISAAAGLAADSDTGLPIGVTVTADSDTGDNNTGLVRSIDFSGMTARLKNYTDTALVTFDSIPTGNIEKTVHIKGFASGTATVPTMFDINGTNYYLTQLDSDTTVAAGTGSTVNSFELLKYNENWIKTPANGWKYFKNGNPTFNGYADISIGSAGDSDGNLVWANIDGAPRGIEVGSLDDGSMSVTINAALGRIDTTKANQDSDSYIVQLNPAQLLFGSGTGVNNANFHILPVDGVISIGSGEDIETDSTTKALFDSDTVVKVDIVNGKSSTITNFRLANLDRDSSNGFELLHNDTVKGWTFNNGKIITTEDGNKYDTDAKRLGSWTFESDVKVGLSKNKHFTFDISEAASLLGTNATLGTPAGISLVSFSSTAGESDVTISASGIEAQYFMFDSDTAKLVFESDNGVHFVNSISTIKTFKDGDTLGVVTVTGTDENRTTGTTVYMLKDLNGTLKDGFEVLKSNDRWTLNVSVDKNSGSTRAWTYVGDSDNSIAMSINTVANLAAESDTGTPRGITIKGGTPFVAEGDEGLSDYGALTFATIAVDSDSIKGTGFYLPKDTKTAFTIDTSLVGGLRNGTMQSGIHIVGYDTDVTVSLTGDRAGDYAGTYWLVDLDSDTSNGLELLKFNTNWRYYSNDSDGNVGRANPDAGKWKYDFSSSVTVNKVMSNIKLAFTLESDAGIFESDGTTFASSKTGAVVRANMDGTPEGITVEATAKSQTITFDKNVLNINTESDTGVSESEKVTFANDLSHITFDYARTGKDGLHIVGLDSDTTLQVGEDQYGNKDVTYYLADLDGDSTNGLELVAQNKYWHRTAEGWKYTNTDALVKVAFTIDQALNPVESNSDTSNGIFLGAPAGIVFRYNTKLSDSDTMTITTDTKIGNSRVTLTAENFNFTQLTAGSDSGLHIIDNNKKIGVGANFTLDANSDTTFTLAELNSDTSNGYEFIRDDDRWTLTNTAKTATLKAVTRQWTYTSDTVIFTITESDTSFAQYGLKASANSDTGIPIGVEVEESDTGYGKSFNIKFGDTDTGVENGKNNVTFNMIKFDDAIAVGSHTGVYGVHITGMAESDTKYAYTYDTNKMFTINQDKYYLADVDGDSSNGYELLKNDANWHRYKTGWTYNDSVNNIYFQIESDTTNSAGLLKADTLAANEGKPLGISVSGSTITIDSDTNIAQYIVFSTGTSVSNVHFVFGTPDAVNEANSSVTSYKFSYFDKSAKLTYDKATGKALAPSSDSDTTQYYLAHVDTNTNDWELVRYNDNWHRYDDGWFYVSDSDTKVLNQKISFLYMSTTPSVKADGSPSGITVDGTVKGSVTKPIIKIATGTSAAAAATSPASAADNLILFRDNNIGFHDTDTHISIQGAAEGLQVRWYNAESDTVVHIDSDKVYTTTSISLTADSFTDANSTLLSLYNADTDTKNGFELTYNGWLTFDSDDKTFYSYVRGTNTNKTSNISFAISVDDKVLTTATSVSSALAGFTTATKNSFTFTAGNTPTEGVVMASLTSYNFHVLNPNTGSGSIGGGSKVTLGGNTYRLKYVDSDTFNGYELISSDGNWAKNSATSVVQLQYIGPESDTFKFYVGNPSQAQDSDYNFMPDKFSSIKATNTGATIYGSEEPAKSAIIYALKSDSDVLKASVTGYFNYTAYSLESLSQDATVSEGLNDTYYGFYFEQTGSNELPANEPWVTTGYDIESLLGYDNPDTEGSGEFGEIMEIKPLATTDDTFDASELLTGVGKTDKTISALALSAARKKGRQ